MFSAGNARCTPRLSGYDDSLFNPQKPAMIRLFALLSFTAVAFSFSSCDQHSWKETQVLHESYSEHGKGGAEHGDVKNEHGAGHEAKAEGHEAKK